MKYIKNQNVYLETILSSAKVVLPMCASIFFLILTFFLPSIFFFYKIYLPFFDTLCVSWRDKKCGIEILIFIKNIISKEVSTDGKIFGFWCSRLAKHTMVPGLRPLFLLSTFSVLL